MDISAQIMSSVASFTSHSLHPFLLSQESELSGLADNVEATQLEFAEQSLASREEVERMHALYEIQKKEASAEEARTKELEGAVGAMQLRASTLLPAQVASLTHSVNLSTAAKDKLQTDVDNLTAMHVREIDAVSRGVNLFRRVLGVEFVVKDAKLHVQFAYIRPIPAGSNMDPSIHTHSISLFVDENKEYQIAGCNPPMEAIHTLLAQLNASNNFAAFITQVRKEFVKGEKAAAEENKQ